MTTVAGIWLFHFLQSEEIQTLWKRLGLDKNRDGSVNIVDLITWAAEKKWGWWLGMKLLKDEIDAVRAKSLDAIIEKCINAKFKDLSAKIEKLEKMIAANQNPVSQPAASRQTGSAGSADMHTSSTAQQNLHQ